MAGSQTIERLLAPKKWGDWDVISPKADVLRDLRFKRVDGAAQTPENNAEWLATLIEECTPADNDQAWALAVNSQDDEVKELMDLCLAAIGLGYTKEDTADAEETPSS